MLNIAHPQTPRCDGMPASANTLSSCLAPADALAAALSSAPLSSLAFAVLLRQNLRPSGTTLEARLLPGDDSEPRGTSAPSARCWAQTPFLPRAAAHREGGFAGGELLSGWGLLERPNERSLRPLRLLEVRDSLSSTDSDDEVLVSGASRTRPGVARAPSEGASDSSTIRLMAVSVGRRGSGEGRNSASRLTMEGGEP